MHRKLSFWTFFRNLRVTNVRVFQELMVTISITDALRHMHLIYFVKIAKKHATKGIVMLERRSAKYLAHSSYACLKCYLFVARTEKMDVKKFSLQKK